VCGSKDAQEDDDVIVICEGCNVGTHQSCYGRDELRDGVPVDDWYCERCKVVLNS